MPTLKHALKLKSERVLGIEHPQETGEKKLPSKAFADFMDEYQVYLRDIKRASDSYQKMNHSTINIVKSYLTSIRRPRILLSTEIYANVVMEKELDAVNPMVGIFG